MSRIGRKPIKIPDGVKIRSEGRIVTVSGKLGELTQEIHQAIKIKIEESKVLVTRSSELKKHRELHGLYRALLANMITGVSEGFSKTLKLVGIGYSADAKRGKFLILNIGYSHAIYLEFIDNITIETPDLMTIIIKGSDKQLVGQVAAKIRSFREPEPYKGKGIRYIDEYVRRKAGKTIGGK